MSIIIDTLRGALGTLWGAVLGEPVPTTGATPATPTSEEPLSTTTVSALRAMLDEHDRGVFLRSALLADLMRRDADLYGALAQRVLAFQALPTGAHPSDASDDSEAAKAAAAAYLTARPAIITQGAQCDMLVDACLLGFSLAQLVWLPGESGVLVPRLEPWPASGVEYDRTLRQWFALTRDQGRLAVTPGDGQWVLYTPRGHRAPWLWGAIRCTGEWYVRDSDAASDAARRAEVFGNSIWKAKLPAGARQTADGKAFAGSLRTMGRNAVIPCPQGETPKESYDVELVEAQADAHQIYEFLLRTGGGRMRLAILGQDLTSQNNTVGTNASSTTGMSVTDRVIEAEARAWSAMETSQIAAPRARYLGEPAVRVCVDAEPEDDRAADAAAQSAIAASVTAWRALGVDVDVDAAAARARVPLLKPKGTPAP